MGTNAGRRVAVIGGGIGGLTTALAFARQGAEVLVYEQAEALTEVGAGLQISPNGARALEALGLHGALDARGLRAEAVVPHDAMTGRAVTRFSVADQVPPYRFFHRADLLDLLAVACAAEGVQLALGQPVMVQSQRLAVAGTPVEADLIVAADGLHSVARPLLNGQVAPFFTGQVAWRAVVEGDHPAEARIWMAPGRHLVSYPLSGGRVNLVAVQERKAWAEEGWHHADHPAHLRAVFSDCAEPVQNMLERVRAVHLWGLFRHEVAEVWQNGQVALVGDAAHPTLPFLAQGANLAIEDAFVLARLTDQTRDLPKALVEYQQVRKGRVSRAIEAANANARNYHLSGLKRVVAHRTLGVMGAVAPGAFMRRMRWLYGYDVTKVG